MRRYGGLAQLRHPRHSSLVVLLLATGCIGGRHHHRGAAPSSCLRNWVDGPTCNLQHAVDSAPANLTIYVAAGTYFNRGERHSCPERRNNPSCLDLSKRHVTLAPVAERRRLTFDGAGGVSAYTSSYISISGLTSWDPTTASMAPRRAVPRATAARSLPSGRHGRVLDD